MDEYEIRAFEEQLKLIKLRSRKYRGGSHGTKIHYHKVRIERYRSLSRTYRAPLEIPYVEHRSTYDPKSKRTS